jgi:hypothetical protein
MRIALFILTSITLQASLIAQNTAEAVLKNGRSVVYYKTNGVMLRELEPEENEYQQYAMAKVMNVFNTVAVPGYQRAERWTTDIEDIGRTPEDDKAFLPVSFRGLVVFQPTKDHPGYELWEAARQSGNFPDSFKLMIAVDVNVRNFSMNVLKPMKKQADSLFTNIWFTEKAELKTPLKMYSYYGPITCIIAGNTNTPVSTATSWSLTGSYPKPGMLSISNIVIRIAGKPELAQQVIQTINRNKINECLSFREKWP